MGGELHHKCMYFIKKRMWQEEQTPTKVDKPHQLRNAIYFSVTKKSKREKQEII